MKDEEQNEILRDLIREAIPVNPAVDPTQFVSRAEFIATIKTMEVKIEAASLRTKQWVLAGCLAVIISFVGGYASLISKLNELTNELPKIEAVQQQRGPWIQREEQRNNRQDDTLHKLDKTYSPFPYEDAPQ